MRRVRYRPSFGRLVGFVFRLVTFPLHRAAFEYFRRTSPGRKLGTVPIVEFVSEVTDHDYQALDEAWQRVAAAAPWHQAHFSRYVRAIVFADKGATYLSPLLRLAVIDVEKIRKVPVSQTAADLVAVACGARLSSYGWWHEPQLRHRLSRLQFEASVDFARRLPDGVPLVEELTYQWHERAWQVNSVGDGVEVALRRDDAPSWLAKLAGWWHRRLDS
jgi:hypothetical protein